MFLYEEKCLFSLFKIFRSLTHLANIGNIGLFVVKVSLAKHGTQVRPLVSTADAEGPAEAFGTRKPPNKEVSNGAPGKVQQKETI